MKSNEENVPQQTIMSAGCVKCGSFIDAGAAACSVCGFPIEPQMENPSPPSSCPRCGTPRQPDYSFCKICKHPFGKNMQTDDICDQEPSCNPYPSVSDKAPDPKKKSAGKGTIIFEFQCDEFPISSLPGQSTSSDTNGSISSFFEGYGRFVLKLKTSEE